MIFNKNYFSLIFTIFLSIFFSIFLFAHAASAQEFTYQGKLASGSTPVNQPHDFEFRLYSDLTGGAPLGTNQRLNVPLSGGVFTVTLDFGNSVFNGSTRFLEIAVKPAGSANPHIILTPRQSVTNAPYAIRSVTAANADNAINAQSANNAQNANNADNAARLGGVAANQFVQTGDPRLTDERHPLANSPNYIRNTPLQQSSASFNISGTGTIGGRLTANTAVIGGALSADSATISNALSANSVNAQTQFNIGGNRVLFRVNSSLFVGGSGNPASTASSNTFVGQSAASNITSGSGNSIFGTASGLSITTGDSNTLIGDSAGVQTFSGSRNTFLGVASGTANRTGNDNTLIGYDAELNDFDLSFATAIGSGSRATQSNQIVLGRSSGDDDVYIFGNVFLSRLAVGGTQQICRGTSVLATCSSSIRYKTNVDSFSSGLETVRRLRPVAFDWKSDGKRDVGFIAEEVREVEPLLATYNNQGEVEGVKYSQITTVLVNSVNEQQKQIENQQKLIEDQQKQIDRLKKLVCATNSAAEICAEEKP